MGAFGENGFGVKYIIALTVLFVVICILGAIRLWVLRRRAQRETQDIEAVAAASAERATEDVRYLTQQRMVDDESVKDAEIFQTESPAMTSGSPNPFLSGVFKTTRGSSQSSSKPSRATAGTSLAIMIAAATAAAPTGSTISTPLTSLPPTPDSPPKALSPPLSIPSYRRGTQSTLALDTSTPFLPPHELGTSSPSLEKARLVVIPQRIKNVDLDFINTGAASQKPENKGSLFTRRQQKQKKSSLGSIPGDTIVDSGQSSTRSSACLSSASTATELPDIPIVSPFRFSKPIEGFSISFGSISEDRKFSIADKVGGGKITSTLPPNQIFILEQEVVPTPPTSTDNSRKSSYMRGGVKYTCMTPIIEQASTKSFEISRPNTVQVVPEQMQNLAPQPEEESDAKKPSISIEMVEIQETPLVSPEVPTHTKSVDAAASQPLQTPKEQITEAAAPTLAEDEPQSVSNLTHQILTSVYPHFPVDPPHRPSESAQAISEIYDFYSQPHPSPITPQFQQQAQEEFRASMIGAAVSTNLWVPGPWVNFDGYELQSGNFPWKTSFTMSSKPFEESPIGLVPSPCVDDFKCISPKSMTFSENCMTPSTLSPSLNSPV